MRDARRPSVSSAASTTYQRRSISLSRARRSSCSSFFVVLRLPSVPCRRPRTTRRRQSPCAGARRPVEGRPPGGQRRARPPSASILPRPTSRRTATIRRTIPRRKASAADVDRHERSLRRTRTAVNGPDRRPVRRPEGAEVVPAHEDRPGSRHRGDVERDPHPERMTLAKRAARPVPDGVAVFPVPRRIAWVEPAGDPPQTSRIATSAGRSASSARPSSVAVSRPV